MYRNVQSYESHQPQAKLNEKKKWNMESSLDIRKGLSLSIFKGE